MVIYPHPIQIHTWLQEQTDLAILHILKTFPAVTNSALPVEKDLEVCQGNHERRSFSKIECIIFESSCSELIRK